MHPLFDSEGYVLTWGAPLRWYIAHESLSELPTASIDRVIGRNVDRWLPDGGFWLYFALSLLALRPPVSSST